MTKNKKGFIYLTVYSSLIKKVRAKIKVGAWRPKLTRKRSKDHRETLIVYTVHCQISLLTYTTENKVPRCNTTQSGQNPLSLIINQENDSHMCLQADLMDESLNQNSLFPDDFRLCQVDRKTNWQAFKVENNCLSSIWI